MAQFKLLKKLKNGVRLGELHTPHGKICTPFFMPVGTVGSVKGVAPWELEEMGAEIVLSNTYHLYLRPGEQLIKQLGGLHRFMGWNKPILTDSGGYQVFSLAGKDKSEIRNPTQSSDGSNFGIRHSNFKLSQTHKSLIKITDEGVEFTSHVDGSKHLFTPEKVIQIQLDLGVDILMPLDVCPSGTASRQEVERATELTIKWAERAKKYFDLQLANRKNPKSEIRNPKQIEGNIDICASNFQPIVSKFDIRYSNFNNDGPRPLLHGIVQGGLDDDLRRECAGKLVEMDFDGYSVGGLAVDHETRDMWAVVKLMGEILPADKPRYLMGVGMPDDIIKATHLGMDMFDCVLPTRMGRHGSVYKGKNPNTEIRNSKQIGGNIECLNPKLETNSRNSNFDICASNFQSVVSNFDIRYSNFELMNLLNSQYRADPNPIDSSCGCAACRNQFSCAYISHLLRSNEILGIRLATLHNLWQYLNLMKQIRQARV